MGYNGDTFGVEGGWPGLLLLHSPGNTFFRDLAAGETIVVQPGAVLYHDMTVSASLHLEYPAGFTRLTWGNRYDHRSVWVRLSGPGRVAISSVFAHTSGAPITSSSAATTYRW
jgi:uncharacterized protein (AIM24 family)